MDKNCIVGLDMRNLAPLKKSRGHSASHLDAYPKDGLFLNCYPRKVKTERQKLGHLKDLAKTGNISMDIYFDLVEALEVPEDAKELVSPQEISMEDIIF